MRLNVLYVFSVSLVLATYFVALYFNDAGVEEKVQVTDTGISIPTSLVGKFSLEKPNVVNFDKIINGCLAGLLMILTIMLLKY